LADNTRERTQAEAQFKKTQKQKEGAEAMAAFPMPSIGANRVNISPHFLTEL
jgi:hypothetical protein